MKINKSSVFKISGILLVSFLVILSLLFINQFNNTSQTQFSNNGVRTVNGVQTITLKAGLGYSPNRILAKADVPTKLEVETLNTYDCTAYLNIPKLNIEKFLPPTGVTEIDMQAMSSGEEIEGYCGSDTYKFIIKFS